jgi:hypothetical protein
VRPALINSTGVAGRIEWSAQLPPSSQTLLYQTHSPPFSSLSHPLVSIQIRFFLLQNRQGKTRLTKWYLTPPEENDRIKMESDIHRSIVARDKKHTNFVEVLSSSFPSPHPPSSFSLV